MKPKLFLVNLVGMVVAAHVATAQTAEGHGDRAAGRAFALRVCTQCHVVSRRQSAPQRFVAPSFEAIANDPTTTASGLHAFLSTPHPTMPDLILSRREQRNVIDYIMGLKQGAK